MKTAEETVQDFLFKDKPKGKYCNDFDVKDLVNLLEEYAIEYHRSKSFFNGVLIHKGNVENEPERGCVEIPTCQYKIFDKNGIEMPAHYTGRSRTFDEAKEMLNLLNESGEYRPYTMVEINPY